VRFFCSAKYAAASASTILPLGLVFGLVAGHAAPAHAYLDPGTGSMILQLILGGVAGAMVIGKLYWQRVKAVFGFSSSESTDELPATSTTVSNPVGNSVGKVADTDAD
jgi:hypothetical protein